MVNVYVCERVRVDDVDAPDIIGIHDFPDVTHVRPDIYTTCGESREMPHKLSISENFTIGKTISPS